MLYMHVNAKRLVQVKTLTFNFTKFDTRHQDHVILYPSLKFAQPALDFSVYFQYLARLYFLPPHQPRFVARLNWQLSLLIHFLVLVTLYLYLPVIRSVTIESGIGKIATKSCKQQVNNNKVGGNKQNQKIRH